jgi:hypothetical protein
MRAWNYVMLAAVGASCLTAMRATAEDQFRIDIGVAPERPYSYYDVVPYSCTPSGYCGPEWAGGDVDMDGGHGFHGAGDIGGAREPDGRGHGTDRKWSTSPDATAD